MGSITPSIYGLVSTLKLQTWSDPQKLQARENIGAASTINNTFSGLVNFSGTDTPGLQLKSLTTAQINTLASASALPVGSILVDSTTDRIDARLSRGTVELIDSAGGQTIGGSLALTNLFVGGSSGPQINNNSGIVRIQNNAGNASAPIGIGSDLTLSRNASGVLQVGTTAANASGSLLLTNLTASGTINANGGIVMPTSGGYIIGSGAASFSIGDVNDTITFNAGTNLFASPLTLTSGGPLLQNNAGTIEARNNANSAYTGIRCHGLTLGSNVSFPGTAITRQISVGDSYNDGSIFQILNGVTTLVSFSAANGISTGLNVSATNITASGSVFAAGSTNVYSFSSTHPVSAAPSTSWRFGSGWSGNYDTQFIFAYADNAAKVLIDTSGAITAFGGYYVNVPASSSNSIRPLQHGNSFLRFSAPASGIPGNNITVEGWDSVLLNASTGNVRLRIGGADRLVLTNTDLTLTGNLTASGTVRLGTFTVGTLPAAAANTRALAYVTDSSVASFGAVATAGGALGVTVFSNGTNWIVSGGTTQPQKAITSGTAAPSGGVDGDIYLQYV